MVERNPRFVAIVNVQAVEGQTRAETDGRKVNEMARQKHPPIPLAIPRHPDLAPSRRASGASILSDYILMKRVVFLSKGEERVEEVFTQSVT